MELTFKAKLEAPCSLIYEKLLSREFLGSFQFSSKDSFEISSWPEGKEKIDQGERYEITYKKKNRPLKRIIDVVDLTEGRNIKATFSDPVSQGSIETSFEPYENGTMMLVSTHIRPKPLFFRCHFRAFHKTSRSSHKRPRGKLSGYV